MSADTRGTGVSHTETATFDDILDELEALSREHLLMYRVRVGRVLLGHFWGGDARAFASHDSGKQARFEVFFERCGDELARYGLSRRQARDSIRAAIVLDSLPVSLAQRLFLSQVLELMRLHDPTARAEVAQAAVAWDWSVLQLRAAVDAARAGLPLDADADAPGVQRPVDEEEPGAAPAPGRMVTRAEKLVGEVEAWSAQWARVDASRLRGAQRRRLVAAVEALEGRVRELRGVLGG